LDVIVMDYRTLLIQIAALAFVYVLLHNDCMAILKACSQGRAPKDPGDDHHDHMTEDDKAIADAIFGSIAAPLFARPVSSPSGRKSAHVEEVPDDKQETPKEGPTSDSPGASLDTAGSAVRRRSSKRADSVADIDA
jgi:hypothetical protein